MQLPKHAHPIEREILQELVSRIIVEDEQDISIWDGEEYAIERSTNITDVLSAMSHTESDTIIVCDSGVSERSDAYRGSVYVIYGNEPEYVIADYSAHEWLTELVETITDKYEV
jgi:hypothetical protein